MKKVLILVVSLFLVSILAHACSMGELDCDVYDVIRPTSHQNGDAYTIRVSTTFHNETHNRSFDPIPFYAYISYNESSGLEVGADYTFWGIKLGLSYYGSNFQSKTYEFSSTLGPWDWGGVLEMHDQNFSKLLGEEIRSRGCFTHNYHLPDETISTYEAFLKSDMYSFAYVTGPIFN